MREGRSRAQAVLLNIHHHALHQHRPGRLGRSINAASTAAAAAAIAPITVAPTPMHHHLREWRRGGQL